MLERSIKWVMLISGLLTFTMIYALFSPREALISTFGVALEGPVAEIVVRNWGALIAIIGGMLVYGAFRPAARSIALVAAGLSKIVFISLVLTVGRQHLANQVVLSIIVDSVMVVVFVAFLYFFHRGRAAA